MEAETPVQTAEASIQMQRQTYSPSYQNADEISIGKEQNQHSEFLEIRPFSIFNSPHSQ